MNDEKFSRDIGKSAKELMEARTQKGKFWHYAQVLGVGGWMLVIPIIAGAYIGNYLDKKFGIDGTSWTITLILLGVAAGVYNVWYFLIKRSQK